MINFCDLKYFNIGKFKPLFKFEETTLTILNILVPVCLCNISGAYKYLSTNGYSFEQQNRSV